VSLFSFPLIYVSLRWRWPSFSIQTAGIVELQDFTR
jgi:hypothetical protein